MSPAIAPPILRDAVRLLVVDPSARAWDDRAFSDLPDVLRAGDLLVLNDAATLPASLFGCTGDGSALEVRLVSAVDPSTWRVVVFGAGDWRTRTEHRPAPPALRVGDVIALGELTASIVATDPRSSRLLELRFDREGDALLAAIYREGRPVQYAHLHAPLEVWDVQTAYAARPWAVEMPSAGRPLTLHALSRLRDRGVAVATLTHAAGLSATGDPELDAALPLPERFEIPEATIDALDRAKAIGGRVVAVGTTVVRALESSALAHRGHPRAGEAEATLVLGPGYRPSVVHGIVSGMHEPTESHYRLLGAFAPADLLARVSEHAAAHGYRTHEFGDACLVLPGSSAPKRAGKRAGNRA